MDKIFKCKNLTHKVLEENTRHLLLCACVYVLHNVMEKVSLSKILSPVHVKQWMNLTT